MRTVFDFFRISFGLVFLFVGLLTFLNPSLVVYPQMLSFMLASAGAWAIVSFIVRNFVKEAP